MINKITDLLENKMTFLKKDLKHGYKVRFFGWESQAFNSLDKKPSTYTYLSPLKILRKSEHLDWTKLDISLDFFDENMRPINPNYEISEVYDKKDNLIYQNHALLLLENKCWEDYKNYMEAHKDDNYDFVEMD